MRIDRKVEEALSLLRSLPSRGRPIYLLFSGGRDSLVVLDLACEARLPFTAIYLEVAGNTHPLSRETALKALEHYRVPYVHLKSPYDFWHLFEQFGYPGIVNSAGKRWRWCHRDLKGKVWRRTLRGAFVISGVKAGDSLWRLRWIQEHGAMGKVAYAYDGYAEQLSVLPIASWTSEDVQDYIRMRGLEGLLDPCYRLWGGGGNCTFCFFMAEERWRRLATCDDPFCRQVVANVKRVHRKLKARGWVGVKKTFTLWERRLNQATLDAWLPYY